MTSVQQGLAQSVKAIVAGGRDFDDSTRLMNVLDDLFPDGAEIVSGGARGADKLGEVYAGQKGLPLKLFPADWEKNGKAAGHIRNREMGDYATHLVAFWDGKSRGTQGMLKYAEKKNLTVTVIYY